MRDFTYLQRLQDNFGHVVIATNVKHEMRQVVDKAIGEKGEINDGPMVVIKETNREEYNTQRAFLGKGPLGQSWNHLNLYYRVIAE